MTTVTVEETGISTARDRLRQAVRAALVSERRAETARTVAGRAAQAVVAAQTAMNGFADLDDRIRRHRVEALRRGSDSALSTELREELRKRDEAREELGHAGAASRTLHSELEAALGEHEAARKTVEGAAADVVIEAAKGIALELQWVNQRRHHLRLLLQSLSVPFAGGNQLGAQTLISAARGDDPDPHQPVDRMPSFKASVFWQDFANRVLADPEAEFPDLPSWEQLWNYS